MTAPALRRPIEADAAEFGPMPPESIPGGLLLAGSIVGATVAAIGTGVVLSAHGIHGLPLLWLAVPQVAACVAAGRVKRRLDWGMDPRETAAARRARGLEPRTPSRQPEGVTA